MVDLVWKVLLPLLGQEAEARAADDPVDHVEVPAHAAVHIVQDHALLGHVVFDDDDAVGAEAPLAAPQELGQVLIGQVAWGRQRPSRGKDASPSMPLCVHLLSTYSVLNTQGHWLSTDRRGLPKPILRGNGLRSHLPKGNHNVCCWDFTLTG